jgi:hypothetical protein
MEVRVVGGPGPNLSISRAGTGDINLGWTADSAWQLRGAANVAGPYTTTTIPAGTALGKFTLPAASATNNFFYHLHYISLP